MNITKNHLQNDTICAIATPAGMGGIAVVRVSGPQAIDIVTKRWQGAPLPDMASHTAHWGRITDSQGQILDEVVLTLYRAPHSFTGEDVIEISCHGSQWIQQQLFTTLIDSGCRMAQGGEFTRRAFASGKMDLSQAEAVADLIAASSRASHRVALGQMRGQFSGRLRQLREQLLRFVSLIELELDFSEEDVTFADRSQVIQLAQEISGVISSLTQSFSVGNAIKNGVPVAIVGATNAGKSTLLNALLHDDRAIVSDIHGTTRDVIEDTIVMGGVLFRLIDTAGIRQSDDAIEAMGIERSYKKMREASLVLWVIDATAPLHDTEVFGRQLVEQCHDKQLVAVINKTDLATPSAQSLEAIKAMLPPEGQVIAISAQNDNNIQRLQQLLAEVAAMPQMDSDAVVVTNVRHYEALCRAQRAIDRAIAALQDGISGDLVSQDIRECLHHLGTITGEITTHDILGEIFAHFCVGK